MKKIIFADASELPVKSIGIIEGQLVVMTNYATMEDLKKKFTDKFATKIIRVMEDGQEREGPYEGYTKAISITFHMANMYEVFMEKEETENTPETDNYETVIKIAQIQAQSFTDEDSLSVKDIFPKWEEIINQTVKPNYKFLYEGELYKVITAEELLVQEQYIPGTGTESLYEVINETNKGTIEDPIPYEGNMELEEGLYYIQEEIIYKCTANTGQPVYHALSHLVGIYVEVV